MILLLYAAIKYRSASVKGDTFTLDSIPSKFCMHSSRTTSSKLLEHSNSKEEDLVRLVVDVCVGRSIQVAKRLLRSYGEKFT